MALLVQEGLRLCRSPSLCVSDCVEMYQNGGFDHGAGHPCLFLDDAKAPNCQKNNGFSDLGNYSEWPKVAGAVIQAHISLSSMLLSLKLAERLYRRSNISWAPTRWLTVID